MGGPVPLALAAYKRGIGKQPELVTLNCYAEKTPKGWSLIARPCLSSLVTVGVGPIRAIFQKDGLFGNDAIILSGIIVYRVSATGAVNAFTGTVPGRLLVSIDGGRDSSGNDVVRIANGTGLYTVTGTTTAREDFPTAGLTEGVTSVRCHRGFWLAVATASEKCYTLIPGDTDWNALSYVTAEYKPDKLKAIGTRGDQIFLGGQESTEVFTLSGSTAPPIVPYGGMVFAHGLRSALTMINVGESLMYVDNKCQVRRTLGGSPDVVSDEGLAEQIASVADTDLRAWSYSPDGHEFYVLTLGQLATWIFDTRTEFWHRADSKGYGFWRAHLGADLSGQVLAVDAVSSQPIVYRVLSNRLTDDDDEVAVEWTAILNVRDGSVNCDSLTLDCLVGEGTATGQAADPMILMRWSDDEGKTWTRWFAASLGKTGASRTRIRYNRMGQTRGPAGRLYQLRRTDPVGSRFSQPILNEAA